MDGGGRGAVGEERKEGRGGGERKKGEKKVRKKGSKKKMCLLKLHMPHTCAGTGYHLSLNPGEKRKGNT